MRRIRITVARKIICLCDFMLSPRGVQIQGQFKEYLIGSIWLGTLEFIMLYMMVVCS